MLAPLATVDRQRLLQALATVETLLGARTETRVPYLLRPPHPGDLGWVVQRNAEIYAREYGWNEEYEALVAEIVAQFVRSFDAKRERCWMAERESENVGCVFLVRESQTAARLRLLLVDPVARGLGIGRRLVAECTHFARAAGYDQIVLWTNSVLDAARHLYEQEGYHLVSEEPHHSFGHDLVGQTWMLDLRAPAAASDN
jgi:GNAT superfamily N-acetyltransferase